MKITLPLQKETVFAVGIMSGTSVDGIDAALVKLTGSGFLTKVELLAFETLPFSDQVKAAIFASCHPEFSSVSTICELNVTLGTLMAQAAKQVVAQSRMPLSAIDFISSHGQTLYHLPEKQATLQIGELAVIAHETGILTVGDFRPSDLAAGGQGAPLVPFVDQLLFQSTHAGRIILNIGGMANLTVLPKRQSQRNNHSDNELIAFDTGPGNVLIDEIVRIGSKNTMQYDENGAYALKGTIQQDWVHKLLSSDPFFSLPYPKSTGREVYNKQLAETLWQEGTERRLSFEDIVATISAFTTESISQTIIQQIDPHIATEEIYVGGGGARNAFLMKQLQTSLNRPVYPMEQLNDSSDAKEAIAFAILGNEFLRQQPNNVPAATGAQKAISMGKLALPF
ncbi:anhydro-N-acetylmuramic acid kinase [Bacillus sp. Marseille-P3800]|uniref:anhydro-N-acetylmuramic acid kinase n=1 Tax=Bacillus sp. Marseille-P3800 TaxID=2014782 RepID=UPI000C08AADD|nr:anhydro-N-acetylmuramic acid kinase [Bacillus sp. Marseille-P3800]